MSNKKFYIYEDEIGKIKEFYEREVKELKESLDKLLEDTIKQIEINYFKKYDGEKQELYQLLRETKILLAREKGKQVDDNAFAQHISLFEEGSSGLSFIDDPEDEKDLYINKLK